jgi:hypothetical protein
MNTNNNNRNPFVCLLYPMYARNSCHLHASVTVAETLTYRVFIHPNSIKNTDNSNRTPICLFHPMYVRNNGQLHVNVTVIQTLVWHDYA